MSEVKPINLSQKRREEMLGFLEKLKKDTENSENYNSILREINQIESFINEKKYGLVWEQHEEAVDAKMKTHIPVFKEVKEREILHDKDLPFNFLLEGDNLHSLKLLEKTHRGKIDVIYIDPPYNTGNKDFIYNDKYVDKTDAYSHSKWLSFMSERLKIAKNLLSDEGVIFISIDDNEQAQLKLLCDEVFGEGNFVNTITVNMKNIAGASGGGEDKRFKKNVEYLLIYSKNYELMPLFYSSYNYYELYELIETMKLENRSWKYTTILEYEGDSEYIASTFDGKGNEIKIYRNTNPITKSVSQKAKEENISIKEVYYKYYKSIVRTTMPQSSIRERVKQKIEELNIDHDLFSIEYIPISGKNKGKLYKQFYKGKKFNLIAWLNDVVEVIDDVVYKKELNGTYWNHTAGTKNLTKEGNVELKNGKKPLSLLKDIIKLYYDKHSTVLDFFAGSGTTGHAVMQLNKEDGGNRKYILCTNNENNICEEVTYQRLKNIQNELPHNLKYYKTDFIEKFSSDEVMVLDKMMSYIKELIELEYHINLDDKRCIIVDNENIIDEAINTIDNGGKLFIKSGILLTTEHYQLLLEKEVTIVDIPEYYFKSELKEVGEL